MLHPSLLPVRWTLDSGRMCAQMRLDYLIGPHMTLPCLWNKGAFPNCQTEPVEGLKNYVTRVVRTLFNVSKQDREIGIVVRGQRANDVNENTSVWGKQWSFYFNNS